MSSAPTVQKKAPLGSASPSVQSPERKSQSPSFPHSQWPTFSVRGTYQPAAGWEA